MSLADRVFKEDCLHILKHGQWQEGSVRAKWSDGSDARAIKTFALVNRYDLQKEFPILTIRPINFKAAVDEVLWIWQRKSNRLADLNSKIWDAWAREDGTIGKAYGYQLAQKVSYPEGEFDQVDKLLYDLKHNPQSRRLICHMYNIADLPEMALYPCAYSLTFHVSGGRLHALLNQRSQDMLVANGWNVCQYAVLLHIFARSCGLEAGELVHVVADAHIYDRHIPLVEELIGREEWSAPKLLVDPDVENFYDFRADSFSLCDYRHGAAVRGIEVAV